MKYLRLIYRKRYFPFIVYSVVAIILLLPSLGRGQLFLLDMPWPEKFYLSTFARNGISAHLPIIVVLWLLNFIIPAFILQKLLLVSLIAFSGYGLHRLLRSIKVYGVYAYIGGLLYAVNPFVLERLLAGQWLVLFGYAVMPYFIVLFGKAYAKPSKSNVLKAFLVWLLLFMSIHYWYMATMFLLPLVLYRAISKYNKQDHFTPKYAYGSLVGIALSLVWIIPSLNRVSTQIEKFSSADFNAFATDNALSVFWLQGFWYSTFGVASPVSNLWIVACLGLVLISLYSLYLLYRKRPKLAYYLALCFITASILAMGYANQYTRTITDVVRSIIPGYDGMRDTQKYVGLLALAFSVAVPYGLQKLRGVYKIVLVIPIIALFAMVVTIIDIRPKLKTYTYPPEWKQANQFLVDKGAKKVIVLPWNGYLKLNFANNAFVANPASIYFAVPVDTRRNSLNPTLDTTASQNDQLIISLRNSPDALKQLRDQGYDYILAVDTGDSASYLQVLQNTESVLEGDGSPVKLFGL